MPVDDRGLSLSSFDTEGMGFKGSQVIARWLLDALMSYRT